MLFGLKWQVPWCDWQLRPAGASFKTSSQQKGHKDAADGRWPFSG
ncbi:hypothetical protein SynBIOSE41_03966 [Synechococcus sp. BIOS-E4-1]|nr:hypothetical protein SynBIOSE41_03966 [Synechococcus sp. BIOS-E4-1]